MSEQVLKRTNAAERSKIRTVAQVGMLGALATILMLFEFPIPFIAPPFYQMDFSEVPVLVGAFAMGPLAGIAIEAVKILLNFVINGTITAGVGELANFVFGCCFLLPAAIIYRRNKSRKSAIIGMALGTIVMTIAACIINAFVMLPAYGAAFGMPVDAFVQMGSAINSAIDNMFTFAVLAVGPFNLLKGAVISIIVLVLYKRIRVILRGDI